MLFFVCLFDGYAQKKCKITPSSQKKHHPGQQDGHSGNAMNTVGFSFLATGLYCFFHLHNSEYIHFMRSPSFPIAMSRGFFLTQILFLMTLFFTFSISIDAVSVYFDDIQHLSGPVVSILGLFGQYLVSPSQAPPRYFKTQFIPNGLQCSIHRHVDDEYATCFMRDTLLTYQDMQQITQWVLERVAQVDAHGYTHQIDDMNKKYMNDWMHFQKYETVFSWPCKGGFSVFLNYDTGLCKLTLTLKTRDQQRLHMSVSVKTEERFQGAVFRRI